MFSCDRVTQIALHREFLPGHCMELTPLRYILAIAETGHMTRAAQRLGVTQPTLSAMLKKLEAELGADLFHRNARGVALTEAGKAFVDHARSAVRAADLAASSVRELVGLERGAVRLAAGPTEMAELLPGVLRRVRMSHPGLRLIIHEVPGALAVQGLADDTYDLALSVRPDGAMAHAGPDLLTVAEIDDEIVLVTPPEHPLSFGHDFEWAALQNEPVVALGPESDLTETARAQALEARVELDIVARVASVDSLLRLVDAGVGLGFVSRLSLADGEGVPCRDGGMGRVISILRRRDRVPSHATAAVEQALVAGLPRPSARRMNELRSPASA